MTSGNLVLQLRNDIDTKLIYKKMLQKNYLCDILQAVHDSSTVVKQKIEIVVLLEENIVLCPGVEIDEVLASLKACLESSRDAVLSCQLLTTITTLMIHFDVLSTDIGRSFTEYLSKQVTSNTESTESLCVRSCCCQCLCQIEEWNPGALWMDRDYICKAYRQEKTFLHQDYAILITRILANGVSCQLHVEDNGENDYQRQQSVVEPQEIRQIVSLVMENPELYTPSGLWHVVTTVKDIAQHCHHVSPSIFKPLMLSSMSTMDPVIMHLIVYIMMEFENEILTETEESMIVRCLVKGLDHPSMIPAQRLFFAHWLKILIQDSERDYGVKKYQLDFYPSVFDPIDCQLSKLLLLNACIPPLSELPSDMNGALLLASTGYLHKLVWHTGQQRAVVVLFRALFSMYQRHCSRSFSQDINRFIKGLISGFPHFIPHAIDFLECLKETTSDSTMFLEILTLLHSQVTSTTAEDLTKDYQYYIQVLKKVSLQKEISPQGTIKFLTYLVQNAASIDKSSWVLGNGILAVCHNLLVCHGTQHLYTDIGDILYNMMLSYEDMDIQDRALFYYLLLTSASSKKIQEFLKKTSGAQNFSQTLSSLIPEEKSGTMNCSNIIDAEPDVLLWRRKIVQPFSVKGKENFEDLTEYLEWLSSTNIVIKASYLIDICNDGTEKVQAVIVNFSQHKNFEITKAVHVAEIRHGETVEVEFSLKSRFAVPATFKAWVEFTDRMMTYRNDLEDVEISLLDMFLPLPGGAELYDKLWQRFTESDDKIRMQCVQSIKVVHKPWQEFTQCMDKLCEKYRIDKGDNKALYGMLSASGHHLLLKCNASEEQTNISIATDSYHMLPFVDQFLSNL